MRTVFAQDAVELARQAGLRQRTMSFTQLASLLVLGWWKQPPAGPSALARFAGSLGVCLDHHTVACHFTEHTATWLLAQMPRAVAWVVSAKAVGVPLLRQCSAVLLEEGSTISLPSALKSVWGGCGGSAASPRTDPKTHAALKITLRWELLHGQLHGPYVQEGRRHELRSLLHAQVMQAGSLWIADLGYGTLKWLRAISAQGVCFLMRYKAGIVLWLGNDRLDLLGVLPQVVGARLDLVVDLGASKLVRGVRLLAERVPAEVASQRQARICQYASDHGKPVHPLVLELANWTLVVTKVPATMLSFAQALALGRARGPIELLFKLWKEHGLLDEWNTSQPWHIRCEVSAKLLALVVHHWFLLLACWDDPHRSLAGVAEVLSEQVPTLVQGLTGHLSLQRAVRLIVQRVRGGCSIPPRSTRVNTSRLLQSAWESGLT